MADIDIHSPITSVRSPAYPSPAAERGPLLGGLVSVIAEAFERAPATQVASAGMDEALTPADDEPTHELEPVTWKAYDFANFTIPAAWLETTTDAQDWIPPTLPSTPQAGSGTAEPALTPTVAAPSASTPAPAPRLQRNH